MRKFLHSHWKVIVAILLAIVLATMTVDTTSAIVSPPLSARLRAHVEAISPRNQQAPPTAHIEAALAHSGYGVRQHTYQAGGLTLRSIEAKIANVAPGARPDRIFIVGARHDPAAREKDGTAAVLELARLLKDLQPSRGTEIRFVFSIHDGKRKPPAREEGQLDAGSFIAYAGTLESSTRVRQALAAFSDGPELPSHGLAAPAHAMGVTLSGDGAFGRHGTPTLMVTDTAFLNYPYHHAAQGGRDKIDYDAMARAVEGLRRTIASLAGAVQA